MASTTCPVCGSVGRNVDTATLKALLAVSLRQLRAMPYAFCATATCDVAYFTQDGAQTFDKAQVRVPIYQKEADDTTPICYCFGHTVADVRRDGAAVVADIEAGIQADQCACDWRNPQGTCCLGNVKQLAKRRG